MQLGARGVSILYSSGDIGVAGARLGTECTDFVPTFPNTCPYITSVRTSVATLLQTGSLVLISVLDRLVLREASIQKKVLIFQQEDSQTSSLFPSTRNQLLHLTWRDLGQPTPVCSTQYAFCNSCEIVVSLNCQTGRGFPDVAAQGQNFTFVLGGKQFSISGTSFSAPTFSSFIGQVNALRIKRGESVLGFLNPLFYSTTSLFTDITSGNNPGCGTEGFSVCFYNLKKVMFD